MLLFLIIVIIDNQDNVDFVNYNELFRIFFSVYYNY